MILQLQRILAEYAARHRNCDAFRRNEKTAECHWLKPQLVAQIEYADWKDVNHRRHSEFIGLRDDKLAKDVAEVDKMLDR
jgi:bifunctional non-homologous end joining protein LigD